MSGLVLEGLRRVILTSRGVRTSVSLLFAGALAMGSCIVEAPSDPVIRPGVVPLMIRADVGELEVVSIEVEVSAPGIEPISFGLEVSGGIASKEIELSAGPGWSIEARAFDRSGIVTHRASAHFDLYEGENDPLNLLLEPIIGSQAIGISISDRVIVVTPATGLIGLGDTLRLIGTIIDLNGDTLPGMIEWASLNPARASIDSTGLVQARLPGLVDLVATHAGLAVHLPFEVAADSVVDPGAGSVDSSPPELLGLEIEPRRVDVDTGTAVVGVRVSAADRSGINRIIVIVSSPSGEQLQRCEYDDLPAPRPRRGSWTCQLTIPEYSEPGLWFIQKLEIWDTQGNPLSLGPDELEALDHPYSFEVIGSRVDSMAPELVDLVITPDTLDLRGGGADAEVVVSATDDGSGVGEILLTFWSPSGISAPLGCRIIVDEPAKSGRWTCVVSFPPLVEGGNWELSLILYDRVGNILQMTGDDLREAGLPSGLEVISEGVDTIPPELTGLSFTPMSVDLRDGAAEVEVRVSATDEGIGVQYISPTFVSPSGEEPAFCMIVVRPNDAQVHGGSWSCMVVIPAGAEGGTWLLVELYLSDHLGNVREVGADELRAEGYPVELEVISR